MDNKKIAPYGMGLKISKNDDGTYSFPGNEHRFNTIQEVIAYIKKTRFFQQQKYK
jgi:hypothetical protein